MHLGKMKRMISQANAGNTSALSPPAFSVKFSQARDLPNGRTCGNSFNMRDLANDFKVHSGKIAYHHYVVNLGFFRANRKLTGS
jgi:hypothetical protein